MPNYVIDQEIVQDDPKVVVFRTKASPRWYLQLNLPGKGQHRESLKTTSLKQARINARRRADELFATGTAARPRRATVAEAAEQYLDAKRDRVHPATQAIYARYAAQFTAHAAGKRLVFVDQVDAPALAAYERRLREVGAPTTPAARAAGLARRTDVRRPKPLAAKTVRAAMKWVTSLLRWCGKRGLLRSDTVAAYELPPGRSPEARCFSPEELASILADPECGPTWTLAVRACLRCGELAWLTADDVLCGPDGNPAAVHIRAKTCPFTGEGWQPKGGHERTVPLAAEAAEVVRACLADVAARRDSRARWLFVNPDARAGRGGRWMRNALTARLNRRLAACGIAGGHLHTLRHTGITAWAVAGMPQPQLQRLAGHRDGQTTAVYIHARDQDVADSLRAIEASGRLASLVAAGVSAARTAA